MKKATWTSTAILLGAATLAHGQVTPPFFGNPSAMPGTGNSPSTGNSQEAPAQPATQESGPRSFGLPKLFAWAPAFSTPQTNRPSVTALPATGLSANGPPVSSPPGSTPPVTSPPVTSPPYGGQSTSWPSTTGPLASPTVAQLAAGQPNGGQALHAIPVSGPTSSTQPATEPPRGVYPFGTNRGPTPPSVWKTESKLVSSQPSASGNAAAESTVKGSEALNEVAYRAGPDRLFVQLDMLTWGISRPDVTTIGDNASEGIVTVGGNSYFRSNSLDTSFISSDWSLGGRVDFGKVVQSRGWMGSVLFYRNEDQVASNGVWFVPSDPDGLLLGYQDSDNDNIDDDINGNQIYGRSGQDLAPFDGTPDQSAPIDAGDLVNWLVTFDVMTTTNKVELTGIELMDVYRPQGWGPFTWEWSWGLRYLEYRERFGAVATGGVLGTSIWNVDSDNDILGPQLGARLAINREWYRVTAEGRFLAGANFQNDQLSGSIATGASPGGVNQPVALEATSFNTLLTNTEFSPVGEWRVEASYYASSWLAFRIGYTGMVVGGVSRASSNIAYTLPSFSLTDSNDTVLVNGLNFGLEINR